MSDSSNPGEALRGRVALVTGASSGIGAALAASLARAGVRLLLSGRDAGRLEAVAGRARATSPQVETAAADLEDADQVRALAGRAEEVFARLDLLVHAAGALHWGPVATAPLEELDRQLAVNVRAPYLLTQLLLPLLGAASGQIVFLNSNAVRRPASGMAAYAASKHALLGLADCLREEVAASGVRVLSAFPGRTATPMQQELRRLEGEPYDPAGLLQPDDVAALVLEALALPPRAEVTDLYLRPRR
ncbi:MAG TPA: SDR family NAD(P)-dependent oxidoreductase [Thermoanaerobaculia bacterium]|nr:SDR family NAD(P)-dependent oxidoreductase [Thermoanaerobaculia bacterium]